MYNANGIEEKINTSVFGKRVVYKEFIDSTNKLAKEIGAMEESHGVLVVADTQHTGRGRLGRSWDSPSGMGIWMSLIIKPDLEPIHASMLTLVAALSVNEALKSVTGLNTSIKWPNDIVLNRKKICGILTEMVTKAGKLDYVVVGIGVNVNTKKFPKDLPFATSLYLESGKQFDRSLIIAETMKMFEKYFHIFMKTKNLINLRESYNNALVNKDQEVKMHEYNRSYQGIARGIDGCGALIMEINKVDDILVQNEIKKIVSGEVSIRGMYGYI